jgi:hypothetical protein
VESWADDLGHLARSRVGRSPPASGSWREGLRDRETRVWRFGADGSLLWRQEHGGGGDDLAHDIARLEDESLVVGLPGRCPR